MSFHDPGSDLSSINRDAHRRAVAVDPWTFDVLVAARELFRRSGGAFDCTVAPLLVERGVLPPTPVDVDPEATFADVLLDDDARTVRCRVPLAIDLGGIAKGFAVDRAIDALAAHGVASAVVNAGGDLRVLGVARGADPRPRRRRRRPRSPGCSPTARARRRGAASMPAVPAARRRCSSTRARAASSPAAAICSVVAPTCLVADALTKVAASLGADGDALLASFDAVRLSH